jgi:hypothetical protein
MGTTLTGTTPQDTYDSLIKVTDNGPLSATAKFLSDGLGNDSALAMSTTKVGINTSSPAVNLHISGDANNRASLRLASTAANRLAAVSFYGNNVESAVIGYEGGSEIVSGGVQGDLIIRNVLSGKDIILDTNAGNVGIGTLAPAALLDARLTVNTNSTQQITRFAANNVSGELKALDVSYTGSDNLITIGSNAVGTDPSISVKIGVGEVARFISGGLTFNGDTAAANALDDYEEGTFTPTIAGSTTAGTATYTTQLARYTKIGRQVSCQIDLGYNSGTGTGNLTIAGLPFTDAGLNNPAVTIGYLDGITLTALNYAMAYLASGTTRIDFVQIPTGGGSLTSVAYDSEGRIILNVTYTA